MDEQIFHCFEQGSMWLRKKESKDAPQLDKTHLLPQGGLTLTWYPLKATKDGGESLLELPCTILSGIADNNGCPRAK